MDAYKFFLHFHSGFRYIVLVLMLVSIVLSLRGWLGNKPYTEGNRKINLFAMISAHTQLLIGLVLYFLSPFVKFGGDTMSDKTFRYWTVEHLTMMIIAIALITIGHARSKRAIDSAAKHKAIAVFYIIAVVVIVAAIVMSGRPVVGK